MKKILLTILTVLLTTVCLSSCGSLSTMSNKDAYDAGSAIGRAIDEMSYGN